MCGKFGVNSTPDIKYNISEGGTAVINAYVFDYCDNYYTVPIVNNTILSGGLNPKEMAYIYVAVTVLGTEVTFDGIRLDS